MVRAHLPDRDPCHACTNFELLGEVSSVNEVDIPVPSPRGVCLVEIESSQAHS